MNEARVHTWGGHVRRDAEFRICLGFFSFIILFVVSTLSSQHWSTNEETIKGLEPPACFLQEH